MKGISSGLRYKSKRLKKKDKKKALPVIRYMVYLLIAAATVTGVSLSRYSASAPADETARTAKFDVVVTPQGWSDNDVSAHAENGSKNYTFTVKNNSEVAVRARLVDAVTGSPMTNVSVTDASYQSIPVGSGGWFDLSSAGAAADTRLVSTSITGSPTGYTVKMRVEYEQID